MDNPVEEISHVIHLLTQTPPSIQVAALRKYFLPSASFTHPLVRVPSFPSSLTVLAHIYRWYKIMSPKITNLRINSIAFDDKHDILYVNLNQTFSIWAIPFHHSHVNLTTVLYLERGVGRGVTDGKERYYIKHQEDLYQTDQWVKFPSPRIAPALVWVWQVVAAVVCMICLYAFAWLDFLEEKEVVGDKEHAGDKRGLEKQMKYSHEGHEMKTMMKNTIQGGRENASGSGEPAHENQAFASGFIEAPDGSGRYVTAPVSHTIEH